MTVGNLLIMVTIIDNRSLGFPMYFCLASLSFIDTFCSADGVPSTITDFLHEKKTVSFQSYMPQVFVDHLFAGAEVILLVVVVYDQYVAICKHLHYLITLNQRVCVLMMLVAWTVGFLNSLIQFLCIYQLPFCGPSITDNFQCDMFPLLKLLALIATSLDYDS